MSESKEEKKKGKLIAVQLPTALRKAMNDFIEQKGYTLSEFVRVCIRDKLEANGLMPYNQI